MELWIRSQDRKRLYKVDEITIDRNMNNTCDIWCNNYLGTYKTKERAIEVLDEIHHQGRL